MKIASMMNIPVEAICSTETDHLFISIDRDTIRCVKCNLIKTLK